MAHFDYVALGQQPTQSLLKPVRYLAGALGGVLVFGLALLHVPQLLGGHSARPSFNPFGAVTGNADFGFGNRRGARGRGSQQYPSEQGVVGGPPGPLQLVPPPVRPSGGADEPCCLFVYTRLPPTLSVGAKSLDAWVYGATLGGDRDFAVWTGHEDDVVQGKLLCWTQSSFPGKLRAIDNMYGFDPKVPDTGVTRSVVQVVMADGSAQQGHCYLQILMQEQCETGADLYPAPFQQDMYERQHQQQLLYQQHQLQQQQQQQHMQQQQRMQHMQHDTSGWSQVQDTISDFPTFIGSTDAASGRDRRRDRGDWPFAHSPNENTNVFPPGDYSAAAQQTMWHQPPPPAPAAVAPPAAYRSPPPVAEPALMWRTTIVPHTPRHETQPQVVQPVVPLPEPPRFVEVFYHGKFAGRAEPILMLLEEAGVPYQRHESFQALDQAGLTWPAFAAPAVRLESGVVLCQTSAICRYLGQALGFDLTDPVISTLVLQSALDANDLWQQAYNARRESFAAGQEFLYGGRLHKWLSHFWHQVLYFPEGPFLFGVHMTYADITLLNVLRVLEYMFGAENLAKFPETQQPEWHRWRSAVESRPGVRKYLKKAEPVLYPKVGSEPEHAELPAPVQQKAPAPPTRSPRPKVSGDAEPLLKQGSGGGGPDRPRLKVSGDAEPPLKLGSSSGGQPLSAQGKKARGKKAKAGQGSGSAKVTGGGTAKVTGGDDDKYNIAAEKDEDDEGADEEGPTVDISAIQLGSSAPEGAPLAPPVGRPKVTSRDADIESNANNLSNKPRITSS